MAGTIDEPSKARSLWISPPRRVRRQRRDKETTRQEDSRTRRQTEGGRVGERGESGW